MYSLDSKLIVLHQVVPVLWNWRAFVEHVNTGNLIHSLFFIIVLAMLRRAAAEVVVKAFIWYQTKKIRCQRMEKSCSAFGSTYFPTCRDVFDRKCRFGWWIFRANRSVIHLDLAITRWAREGRWDHSSYHDELPRERDFVGGVSQIVARHNRNQYVFLWQTTNDVKPAVKMRRRFTLGGGNFPNRDYRSLERSALFRQRREMNWWSDD